MYRLLLLVLGLAFADVSLARASEGRLPQVFKEASDALSQGLYLEAADLLRPLAIDQHGKILDVSAYQLWNQVQADITGEPYRASGGAEDDPGTVRDLSGASARPALASIVSRARGTRIVILNEDHVSPRQRAFALQVAKALRPLGYNVLALEALNNRGDSRSRMTALQRRGYVVLSDGFYTRDPVFADFIRQAIRFGYTPASYEDTAAHDGTSDQRIAAREQGEAENLLALIQSHPRGKFLIYVGQSHLAERPTKNGDSNISWMAERLAKLTGIDPLTVDQTTLESCAICRRLTKLHAEPMAFFRGSKPVVTGQYVGAVDLQIFKPPEPRLARRPGWLRKMGRNEVSVPSRLLPSHGRRLVQAFAASEGADAIPLDQFIVTAGQPAPKFMLPRVSVRFSYQQDDTEDKAPAQHGTQPDGSAH